MKIVKKITTSMGVAGAVEGVRRASSVAGSARRGGSPPLGRPRIGRGHFFQIFFIFFVMKFYFLFVVLNCSLVVIFSC